MTSEYNQEQWLRGVEGDKLPKLIESNKSIIRVVAGPGSGKSLGLKRRVQRLVEGDGIDPSTIFVGTFTRAISQELEETLDKHSPHVSTLHSFALNLLRDNTQVLGGRQLNFLLDFEKDSLLYDVKYRTDDDRDKYELEDALERLQASWAKQQSLEDDRFSGATEKWLREHEAMLVEEVVPKATEALEDQDIPQGMFDHVIIDEYQDLTECEQRMVELIWSEKGSLVVLGDDDQSIYGFRYNHPEGINGFEERHEDVLDIKIPANHRSGENIVKIANRMIAEAGSGKAPMESKRDLAGDVSLVHWESAKEEIQGLAKHMLSRPDQEFLVLVPRRFVGYKLQRAIGEEARTDFVQQYVDQSLIQRRLTLASLVANLDDHTAVRAWLGFHKDGSLAAKRNTDAYHSVFDLEESPKTMIKKIVDKEIEVSGRGQRNILERSKLLLNKIEKIPNNLAKSIDFLFDPDLADEIEDPEKSTKAENDLTKLRVCAQKLRDTRGFNSLGEIVQNIRYRIATRAPLTESEESPRVKIMTLHSAKGLEADVIVIAGAADQMVPGKRLQADEREEQRRLLYVAITRARDELIISWPKSILYSDAKSNHIRLKDSYKYHEDNDLVVSLAKSSLLPNELRRVVSPKSGYEWL